MSRTSPDRMQDPHAAEQHADDEPTDQTGPSGPDDSSAPMSLEEEAVMRAERLRTIRQAIENGAYDSDDILNVAMNRLRRTIERSEQVADEAKQDKSAE